METEIKCDVCDRNLTRNGVSLIGVQVNPMFGDEESVKIWQDIYPELKKAYYNVCYVCWYKSLRIKL